MRDPAGDRVYEEPVVGIPAQGVLGMEDVAQPPVDLSQLVFAQESFNPVRRFLSGDACLRVDRPWVEVGVDALQLPEPIADVLGAPEFLLRPLPGVLVGHQGAEHDEFEQHP